MDFMEIQTINKQDIDDAGKFKTSEIVDLRERRVR